MTLDNTLYITVRTLQNIQDEDGLAILISHEIAHRLLSHSLKRSYKIISQRYFSKGNSVDVNVKKKIEWFKSLI